MNMDKLKMHTPNRADDNFKKLAALFPNAVTETINENGEVVRAIDKDVLMQEISCTVVEGNEERYQFTWPDKKKSVLLANAPIAKTLRPCREESVGKDGTPGGFDSENLYIEGDNLEVLKLLQETYLGKIKMIYIDPACGTAGFLVSASEYIRKHYEDTMTQEQWEHFSGEAFTGFDTDRTMLRISAMNLMLHSISHPEIDYKDSVSKQNEIRDKFTLCLANPPFKGTVDAESINDNLKAVTNTKKTELLFLALFLRMLKKGGRCACIVPDGVLFGSSKAHKAIRKELVENHHLRAVISMPSGVFKPYAGVSTAVLVFTKTGAGGTDRVWFYDMQADGFSLDDKRSPVDDNDIPDIIRRFHNLEQEADRKRTEKSFLVPKQEIADNDYDLSINKYKKVDYVPVAYPPTEEILKDLHALEAEITAGLKELEGML